MAQRQRQEPRMAAAQNNSLLHGRFSPDEPKKVNAKHNYSPAEAQYKEGKPSLEIK